MLYPPVLLLSYGRLFYIARHQALVFDWAGSRTQVSGAEASSASSTADATLGFIVFIPTPIDVLPYILYT